MRVNLPRRHIVRMRAVCAVDKRLESNFRFAIPQDRLYGLPQTYPLIFPGQSRVVPVVRFSVRMLAEIYASRFAVLEPDHVMLP